MWLCLWVVQVFLKLESFALLSPTPRTLHRSYRLRVTRDWRVLSVGTCFLVFKTAVNVWSLKYHFFTQEYAGYIEIICSTYVNSRPVFTCRNISRYIWWSLRVMSLASLMPCTLWRNQIQVQTFVAPAVCLLHTGFKSRGRSLYWLLVWFASFLPCKFWYSTWDQVTTLFFHVTSISHHSQVVLNPLAPELFF